MIAPLTDARPLPAAQRSLSLVMEASHGVRGTILHLQNAATPIFIGDGVLLWNAKGTIVACDAYEKLQAALPNTVTIEDYRGKLITPGLVDCHVHLPQLDCRNKTGHTLLDWLKIYIYPSEAAFADPVLARSSARRFFAELLKNGTTTAMIYASVHEQATDIAFEEAQAAGIRAIIGKVMMDQNCPEDLKETTVDSLCSTERLIKKWHGCDGRLFYAVTPRFALTCSRDLIAGAGALAQQSGAYFQTHFAETSEEVILAKDLHRVKNYLGLYADCQCLGSKSMFAHCIYATAAEWQSLAQSGSAVAHCPSSNIFLQSGRMPYARVAEYKVTCGLGSDVGAGPEFSVWDVIRSGFQEHGHQKFPIIEGFYRATLGGAEALGLGKQIGSFRQGKAADVAVFDLQWNDLANGTRAMQSQLLPPRVLATYVAGECRYRLA